MVQATARRPLQALQVGPVPSGSPASAILPKPLQAAQTVPPVPPQELHEYRPWPRHISQVVSCLMRSETASQYFVHAAVSGDPELSFFHRSIAGSASKVWSLR